MAKAMFPYLCEKCKTAEATVFNPRYGATCEACFDYLHVMHRFL